MSETDRIATFIVETEFTDLPAEVIEKTKRIVLDTIECAIGGHQSDIGKITTEFAHRRNAEGDATILGEGAQMDRATSVYANTRLANALDADETLFSFTHFGNAAVMTALAIAEATDAHGRDLLTAAAVGYEVGARLSIWGPPVNIEGDRVTGWPEARGVGLEMTFAAAAAAANSLDLDVEETRNALGIAGERVPFPTHYNKWDTALDLPMNKYQDAGACARNGYEAAEFAESGATGARDILDGTDGLWAQFGPSESETESRKRRDTLLASLSKCWIVLDSTFKPWPCCHLNQFVLEDLKRLRDKQTITAETIESATLHAPTICATDRFRAQQPTNTVSAQFSHPHSIVMVLGDYTLDQWYDPFVLEDPDVAAVRKRIEVVAEPEPAVTIKDGIVRELEMRLELETADETYEIRSLRTKGMPWYDDTVLSDADLVEKFVTLSHGVRDGSSLWVENLKAASDRLLDFESQPVRDAIEPILKNG